MRTGITIKVFLLMAQLLVVCVWVSGQSFQSGDHGPAVKAFLSYLQDEEEELEFQIERNEISQKGYARAKSKIAILRQTVLDIVKETGEDRVPELHVVSASEVSQLIEDGARALRGVKPGDIVQEKWRYRGRVTRGEAFYVLERLNKR